MLLVYTAWLPLSSHLGPRDWCPVLRCFVLREKLGQHLFTSQHIYIYIYDKSWEHLWKPLQAIVSNVSIEVACVNNSWPT